MLTGSNSADITALTPGGGSMSSHSDPGGERTQCNMTAANRGKSLLFGTQHEKEFHEMKV